MVVPVTELSALTRALIVVKAVAEGTTVVTAVRDTVVSAVAVEHDVNVAPDILCVVVDEDVAESERTLSSVREGEADSYGLVDDCAEAEATENEAIAVEVLVPPTERVVEALAVKEGDGVGDRLRNGDTDEDDDNEARPLALALAETDVETFGDRLAEGVVDSDPNMDEVLSAVVMAVTVIERDSNALTVSRDDPVATNTEGLAVAVEIVEADVDIVATADTDALNVLPALPLSNVEPVELAVADTEFCNDCVMRADAVAVAIPVDIMVSKGDAVVLGESVTSVVSELDDVGDRVYALLRDALALNVEIGDPEVLGGVGVGDGEFDAVAACDIEANDVPEVTADTDAEPLIRDEVDAMTVTELERKAVWLSVGFLDTSAVDEEDALRETANVTRGELLVRGEAETDIERSGVFVSDAVALCDTESRVEADATRETAAEPDALLVAPPSDGVAPEDVVAETESEPMAVSVNEGFALTELAAEPVAELVLRGEAVAAEAEAEPERSGEPVGLNEATAEAVCNAV